MTRNRLERSQQPFDRQVGLHIASLIRKGEQDKVIAIIQEGKQQGNKVFDDDFFNFLLKKWGRGEIPTEANATKSHEFSTASLKRRLSHTFAAEFKKAISHDSEYPYLPSQDLSSDAAVCKILKADSLIELEKALPYKGKIYLPTDKYTEEEQIAAIKTTAAFLSKANGAKTLSRLNALRNLIKVNNFTECLILANGPSLQSTNVSMYPNAFIIGLNSIFLHPYITPHLIVCEDHLVGEDRANELNEHNRSIKAIPGYLTYCVNPDDMTIVLNHRPRISFPVDIDFSADINSISYTGGTVTYTALQLAAGLGFKRISLVGVDASYKVENVKEQDDYSTGIFESLGDDPNHFNSSYFGKGYRWHDPNPLRMMQAYSVAERFASFNGIEIVNLTRGGMLNVFKREDYQDKVYSSFPDACIIDWIDINSNAATGEVKRVLFKDWPKDKLLHLYSPKPTQVQAFRSSAGDIYLPEHESLLPAWKAVIESETSVYYWRPTHNRPLLNLFSTLLFALESKPYAIHIMDYWTIKVNNQDLRSTYEEALEESIRQSSHIFGISQRMKTRLTKKYNLDPDTVTVAHNYIPVPQAVLGSKSSQQQSSFSILYSGSLDPDQSIDPLIDICNAIKLLNSEQSQTYRLIISASDYHRETNGHHFKSYNFVELQPQHIEHDSYVKSLTEADLCILAYGFSIESRQYLLDSMANKLPDLVSANAKFIGYGDPEIGTLNYLLCCQYPFVETSRDPKQLAKRIKQLASMSYNEYSEACSPSLSEIRNEFSEMAQCHVFQRQLSSCNLNVSAELKDASNYSRLISLYSTILSESGEKIPQGISDELSLMKHLISHRDLLDPVNTLVRSHGLTWSVNKTKPYIEKNINKIADDNNLIVQSLAWMIASQRHSRFSSLWAKLFDLIVNT